jgi:hypothetical protein
MAELADTMLAIRRTPMKLEESLARSALIMIARSGARRA